MEPGEASLSDHRDCYSRARPAVEDLSQRRRQLAGIDSAICVRGVLAFIRSDLGRAHRLCSFLASPMGAPSATGRCHLSLPMPAGALASAPEADGPFFAESLVTRLWLPGVLRHARPPVPGRGTQLTVGGRLLYVGTPAACRCHRRSVHPADCGLHAPTDQPIDPVSCRCGLRLRTGNAPATRSLRADPSPRRGLAAVPRAPPPWKASRRRPGPWARLRHQPYARSGCAVGPSRILAQP